MIAPKPLVHPQFDSGHLQVFARLAMALVVATTYFALHAVINAGEDLRNREHFGDAPARAVAFVDALERDMGDPSVITEIRDWFWRNGKPGKSVNSVSLAADSAENGDFAAARSYVDDLTAEVAQDRARLDQEVVLARNELLLWALAIVLCLIPALWLRSRRRAAVADVVDLVSRFVPRRPLWRRPVFLVASAIGSALLVTGFITAGVSVRSSGSLDGRAAALLGGVVAVVIGLVVLRFSRTRSARDAVRALLADGRRPVLYLRSFADDKASAAVDVTPGGLPNAVFSIHSREEQLAGPLNAFGPVIAVGKPGEPLPRLGAARFYRPVDDWQTAILRLMELSQFIVLRLGPGEGLWWEVERARATQPAHKLVLLVPGNRTGIAERLDRLLPKPTQIDDAPVIDPWTSAVITFAPDWTPHVRSVGPLPGVKTPPGSSAHHLARAMEDALTAAGSPVSGLVFRVNTGKLATYGKGLLLLPLAVLVIRALWLATNV